MVERRWLTSLTEPCTRGYLENLALRFLGSSQTISLPPQSELFLLRANTKFIQNRPTCQIATLTTMAMGDDYEKSLDTVITDLQRLVIKGFWDRGRWMEPFADMGRWTEKVFKYTMEATKLYPDDPQLITWTTARDVWCYFC